MKLTRRQLRRLILREMAYGGKLGGIHSGGHSDRTDLVFPGGVDPEKWRAKQLRAAGAYAGSAAFDVEAEKRFRHLDTKIHVIYNAGSTYQMQQQGGLEDLKLSGDRVSSTPDKSLAGVDASGERTRIVSLQQGFDSIKKHPKLSTIDTSGVGPNDVVILYSASLVGSRSDWQKATPWIIFHAIFEQNVEEAEYIDFDLEKLSPTYFKFLEQLLLGSPHNGISNKGKVMTMASARSGVFSDGFGIYGDSLAEMLCQELLVGHGLRLNMSAAEPDDIPLWEEIRQVIKTSAQEVRSNLPGKFIVVGVN